jgi:hypothetical protein
MFIYNNTVYIAKIQLNPISGGGEKLSVVIHSGSNTISQLNSDLDYSATVTVNGSVSNALSISGGKNPAVNIGVDNGNVTITKCEPVCNSPVM